MALPPQRSLHHLRDEVRARCGFGNQVIDTVQQGRFDSWIREAQSDIFWQHDFHARRAETSVNTVASQSYVDWPSNVDPDRIVAITVKVNDVWLPVTPRGIDWPHDTFQASATFPLRYDTGPTLELWPTPDIVYELKIEHYQRPRTLHGAAAWAANSNYSLGDFVTPATGVIAFPGQLPTVLHRSHFVYEVTVDGADTTTEPTWPIVENATVLNGVQEFTARLNTVTVPDSLVLKLALYKAKLHYRQPDAEEAIGAFQAEMGARNRGELKDRRFVQPLGQRRKDLESPPWIPPVRV